MKLSDKNIDQLFRDAAQNSDAPRYEKAYWDEVKTALDEDAKRKRGFMLWAAGGGVISLFLIVLLFQFNTDSSEIKLADNKTGESTEQLQTSQNGSSSNIQRNISTNSNAKDFSSTESSEDQILSPHSNAKRQGNIQREGYSNVPASPSEKSGSYVDSKVISPVKKDNTIQRSLIPSEVQTKENIVDDKSEFLEKNSDDTEALANLKPRIINHKPSGNIENLKDIKLKNSPVIYAKMSGGLMENYQTSRPFQSGICDISLNISLEKNNVLLRTGLGFQMTSNADLIVSQRAKVYGFGVVNHQSNLSYQSLFDVYIPLEFGYSHGNTSFGIGGQLNYLLTTTMNHESLENTLVVSQEKYYGLKEGLNSISSQGYLWLEQKLNERFVAGVKIGTNISGRISEGKYFNESATTNPIFGQLTLRYNITK